jgi:LuxR family maltose regulon positive regulatory protein
LTERLNARLDRKLTLLSAPAGSGKTTLMSEWLENIRLDAEAENQTVDRIAWLSLDEGDNDPIQFLTYIIAALNRDKGSEASLGESALTMLQSPQPPPLEAVLTALINELAAVPGRIILVLDDYHVIGSPQLDDALTFLLEHLPPHIHLVVATREDPHLPMARLRASGQLIELRAADLRFTSSEAAEFFNQVMGLNLSTGDIAALESRTEGWIVGLQLAAISMQGHKDSANLIESFTGSHRYVLDYLIEEVLDQQTESVQAFLLRTSVLNRLIGPLCDVLTGHDNGQETLELLERTNLFVVPLDDERFWYRYHHLFADLLRNQLSKKHPGLTLGLHRLASQWFEQEGLIPEAMHHAIAVEDFDRAALLLESIVSSLLNESRPAMLLSLMANLPDEIIASSPWLCVHGAWAYFITWQFDPIEPLLHAAELNLAEIAKRQNTETYAHEIKIRGRVVALRAFMAQEQGDLAHATELSREALKHLDEDDQQLRSILEMNLGDICAVMGDLTSARRHLNSSIRAGQAAGNYFAALGAFSRLAELDTIQGQLHQAAKTYRQAIQLGIEWGGGKPMPGTGRAHVGLAQVLYEWNDLDGADECLTEGIRLSELCGEQEVVMEGSLTLARLRQAQGMTGAAIEALRRVEAFARRESGIPYANRVSSCQARLFLAQGDLVAALSWVDTQESALEVPDFPDFRFEEPRLTKVRVWIAQAYHQGSARGGSAGITFNYLNHLLSAAEAGGRVGNMIEILILSALASRVLGDVDQALNSLLQALSLAEPGGYMRLFVDEGPPMTRLLYEAARREIAPGYIGRLLVAFETDRTQVEPHPRPSLIEPLSKRELDVLHLLKTDLSGPEIAAELMIALSTVRTHTQNIYSKLGVNNRLAAVRKAEELHLR